MFWDVTHEDLNSKIGKLESKVLSSQSVFGYQSYQWDETIELTKEIHEDFKKVRYPTKAERDAAWQTFSNLRDDVYRIKSEQFEYQSQQHYNEINGYLRDASYSEFGDDIVSIISGGLMGRTTADGMKWKGQQLREAGKLLTKYKHEMTKEHKADIHQRIVEIREQHDIFWERYKEYQKEKQQAWEERRQKAKENIEANIQKNKESLRKAEDALERQKQHRSKLEDNISSAYSDSFRERAEGWLDECNDKISDIESSIERIESWIQEGRDKLNSF